MEQKATELGIRDRVRIVEYPGPIGDVWDVIDIHVHAEPDSRPVSWPVSRDCRRHKSGRGQGFRLRGKSFLNRGS